MSEHGSASLEPSRDTTVLRFLGLLATWLVLTVSCASLPDDVSGRVDLLDVSHAGLATGSLRFVNGTYGPTCAERSGNWSVSLGVSAKDMDFPELSVLRGDATCTLAVTGIVGDEPFTALSAIDLNEAFAANGTAFVSSKGTPKDVVFFANAKLDTSAFERDFEIKQLVSDDPKATTAGKASGSYTGPSSSKSSLVVSTNVVVADGASTITATVTGSSYSGKLLAGLPVRLTFSGNASISPATAVTDAKGLATFSLTSKQPSTGTLTATVTGVLVSQQPTVAFSAVNLLGNGGFEVHVPQLSAWPNNYWVLLAPSAVQPWASNDYIEIWPSGFNGADTISAAQAAAAGDLYFPLGGGSFLDEINATKASTLSQTFTTPQAGYLTYSFWMRGRSTTETMKFEFFRLVAGTWTRLVSDTYSTNTAWVRYTKERFLVAEAGAQYRAEFTAITPGGAANLLDNAAIGSPARLPSPARARGSCPKGMDRADFCLVASTGARKNRSRKRRSAPAEHKTPNDTELAANVPPRLTSR